MENDELVGVRRRGYRGVFWSVFVRGKCIPGVVGLVGKVSINNLLTDWEGIPISNNF